MDRGGHFFSGARVLRSPRRYDLARLAADAERAAAIQAFGRGAYGHAISLPAAEQLDERFRDHPNNHPFADVLGACPSLREVFEDLASPKASFRLLRRGPHSAYGLHDDKDKGVDVIRMQIPIVTNDLSFLVVARAEAAELDVFAETPDAFAPDEHGDIWFDMDKLAAVWGDRLALFRLEPGRIYFFDTDRVHTLINAGDAPRVTLAVDLVLDDWLRSWMERELTEEVPACPNPRSPAIRWQWNALRHGLILN
jgi:hypothetical protein